MSEKELLLDQVISCLKGEIEVNEEGLAYTRTAANDAPSAMQSHSDTTRSQMESLASGLMRNIVEKGEAIKSLLRLKESISSSFGDVVRVGSIVEVREDSDNTSAYFILPAGGSTKVYLDGVEITVLSSRGSLAASLLGKSQNSKIEVLIGSRKRRLELVSVR